MSVELRSIQLPIIATTLAEIEALEAVLAEARFRVLALDRTVDLAAAAYRARRGRDACFGDDADLFGEPAWDILLDLYSARSAGREVTVTSACAAARVPNTTALRHIGNLEERGMIIRLADPEDRRRSILRLSDKVAVIMNDWFDCHTL